MGITEMSSSGDTISDVSRTLFERSGSAGLANKAESGAACEVNSGQRICQLCNRGHITEPQFPHQQTGI